MTPQCDPADCDARCTHCSPEDPCGTEGCVYDLDRRAAVHAAWPKRSTPAETIERIQGWLDRVRDEQATEQQAIAAIQGIIREGQVSR